MRRAYQTDLSDAEWNCLQPHLPAPQATGRPKMHTTREILDAIFYVLPGGCAWRMLPRELERRGRRCTTTSTSGAGTGGSGGPTIGCAKRSERRRGASAARAER